MQSLLLLPCFQSDLCRIKAKFYTVPCLPYLVSLSPLPVPVPIPTTRNHVDSPHELFRLSRGLGQDAGLLCLEPPSQARSLARRPLTEPAQPTPGEPLDPWASGFLTRRKGFCREGHVSIHKRVLRTVTHQARTYKQK